MTDQNNDLLVAREIGKLQSDIHNLKYQTGKLFNNDNDIKKSIEDLQDKIERRIVDLLLPINMHMKEVEINKNKLKGAKILFYSIVAICAWYISNGKNIIKTFLESIL